MLYVSAITYNILEGSMALFVRPPMAWYGNNHFLTSRKVVEFSGSLSNSILHTPYEPDYPDLAN
jgi:hypothetical protein